jgi:hypothetical protein
LPVFRIRSAVCKIYDNNPFITLREVDFIRVDGNPIYPTAFGEYSHHRIKEEMPSVLGSDTELHARAYSADLRQTHSRIPVQELIKICPIVPET